MPLRAKLLALLVSAAGLFGLWWGLHFAALSWGRFTVYLVGVLLGSAIRISLPRSDRRLSVGLPFILLAILQLSPGQAIVLAALSALVECRGAQPTPFTAGQVWFNVNNIAAAAWFACVVFRAGRGHHLEAVPALLFAAVAYFLANTFCIAAMLAWSRGEGAADVWLREFPWYLPFYLVGAALAVLTELIGDHRSGWMFALLAFPIVYTVYRSYMAQMRLTAARQDHMEEMQALHLRTIEGLAMAIEAKDQNTHEHLLRVRTYAAEIGAMLGLDEDQLEALRTAAFLHDIGKLAVPEHILNKPGKLTPTEFEKMKIHPLVGADILERVRFPYPVVPIVRSHHEAWDGSGYPEGLRGEDIPIGARILSVVDCFDALACDRPYRRAMPLDQAMAFVKERAGKQFDPRVVEVLEHNYARLEQLAHESESHVPSLDTNLAVDRGAAPGAGFATGSELVLTAAEEPGEGSGPQALARRDPLGLIAAAGKEAQGLFEIAQMLGSSMSPDETILVMSSRLRRLVPFDCFALYLVQGSDLRLQHVDGTAAGRFSNRCIPVGEGLSGYVAAGGMPIVNGSPHVEPNYTRGKDASQELLSALSIPLRSPSGAVFGVLTLYAARPDAFTREHLRIMQAVESKFALSLENALRHRQTEPDFAVDPLTGLPGLRQCRAALEAELNRARRSGDAVAVAVVDLNDFRHVVQEQGRPFGDRLLRDLATAYREACRSYDTVARVGPNKFVFLFPAVDAARTDSLLEAIQSALRRTLKTSGAASGVTASVGLACFPADGKAAEDILAAADGRMHLEKRRFYAESEPVSAGSSHDLIAVA